MRRLMTLVVLSLFAFRCFAAAVPVTPMQNTVSGVIQGKMKNRGFAGNDPRFSGTLINVGSAVAGAAVAGAAITVAGVTAPAWVSAGLVAGLGAALTYAFSLAANSAYKWLFNSDGTITSSGITSTTGTDPGTNYLAMNQGGSYYQAQYGSDVWKCGSAFSCAQSLGQAAYGSNLVSVSFAGASGANYFYNFIYNPGSQKNTTAITYFGSGAPASCAAGYNYKGSGCVVVPGYVAPPSNVSNVSLQGAVDNIPIEERTKPVDPALIAALVNQAWQLAASQSGYSGVPYSSTDPITASDVQAWQSANPSSYPTVADLVAPQPAPSGGTAATPFSLPTSSTPVSQTDPATQTQTGTNPAASNPLQNLGVDPGIGAPTLEATPTAEMILAPLLNLMPSLKNFVVPNHSGVCPKPVLTIFDKSITLEAHCTLLESVRNTLSAVMAFAWVALAMFIVLRA